MYSEDSSDDEFFDPEEEVAPPSPSWLTRQQSVGVGSTEDWGAGEARAGSGGDPGSSSPSAAAAGADLFVVGSAIFDQSDYQAAIRHLHSRAFRHQDVAASAT